MYVYVCMYVLAVIVTITFGDDNPCRELYTCIHTYIYIHTYTYIHIHTYLSNVQPASDGRARRSGAMTLKVSFPSAKCGD